MFVQPYLKVEIAARHLRSEPDAVMPSGLLGGSVGTRFQAFRLMSPKIPSGHDAVLKAREVETAGGGKSTI